MRWKRLNLESDGHPIRDLAKSPDAPSATTVDEPGIFASIHARPNSRLAPIARTRQVTVNSTLCGIDISKDWLDAHIEPSGAVGRFRNDAAGIAELAAWCRADSVDLVVMEASGGYERLAFLLLWEMGQPCGMANARSVRYFAEAMGFLEKTDRIDAAVIARYGAVKQLKPMPPPSTAQQRLTALVARLSQVGSDLTIQKQRKSAAATAETIASLDEVIALLVRQSRRLEGEIASLIEIGRAHV